MDQQPEVKPLEHSGGYQNGHLIRRIVSLRAVCFDQIANGPKPLCFSTVLLLLLSLLYLASPRDDMIISRGIHTLTIVGVVLMYTISPICLGGGEKKFYPPPPHTRSTNAELL